MPYLVRQAHAVAHDATDSSQHPTQLNHHITMAARSVSTPSTWLVLLFSQPAASMKHVMLQRKRRSTKNAIQCVMRNICLQQQAPVVIFTRTSINAGGLAASRASHHKN